MSDFFKKLKLHELLIDSTDMENFQRKKCQKFLQVIFRIMSSVAYKISHCLSANRNPKLRCIICTGVTLELHVLCSQPIRIE